MKKFTFTLIIMALTVMTFGQTVQNAKSAREAGIITGNVNQPKVTNLMTEGFETFVIPGTMNGWTRTQTNANVTWDTVTYDPYLGLRYVHCNYDDVTTPPAAQNEWLITPAYNLSAATAVSVSFAWSGSKYWSIYPNNNCDLFLKYSTDGGSTWSAQVWSEASGDTSLFLSWTWAIATVSVPLTAGQANVKFALNYVGTDGAEFNVDEFKIDTTSGAGAGVISIANPVNVSIYPNPVTNNLNVVSNSAIQNIRIFNDFGQLVLEQTLVGKSASVNTASLPKGLYFVELTGENGKYTKKITVIR